MAIWDDAWRGIKGIASAIGGDSKGDVGVPEFRNREEMEEWIRQQHAAGGQGAPVASSRDQAFRNQQLSLAGRLGEISSGDRMGPGEMAVQRAGARAVAQQQGMAGMGRGLNAAGAARTAARNQAEIGTNTAGQAMQAGMSDRLQADQTLMGVLSSARGQDQQVMLANLDAELRQRGLNAQQRQAAIQQMMGMDMAEMQANLQRDLGTYDPSGYWGPLISGGAQIGAAVATSDERAKINIKDATLDELLEVVEPFGYDYADPKHGKGRQFGVMAQALEQTEVGKGWVTEDEDGVKRVDYGKAAGAILAAAAKLHKEVNGG